MSSESLLASFFGTDVSSKEADEKGWGGSWVGETLEVLS